MVLWWTKIMAAAGCVGVIIFALFMEAVIGDAHNPWAIFWFFVALAATGAFFFVFQMEPPAQSRKVTVKPAYWKVYHGTPSWNNMTSAIHNGFVPGPDGAFGTAVYTTFDYQVAQSYARSGGYVFRLYINRQVPFKWYHQIPGKGHEEKRAYCLQNGIGLVFHPEHKFFICYGQQGVPVKVPGLEMVEVFDEFGNQVTIN